MLPESTSIKNGDQFQIIVPLEDSFTSTKLFQMPAEK